MQDIINTTAKRHVGQHGQNKINTPADGEVNKTTVLCHVLSQARPANIKTCLNLTDQNA